MRALRPAAGILFRERRDPPAGLLRRVWWSTAAAVLLALAVAEHSFALFAMASLVLVLLRVWLKANRLTTEVAGDGLRLRVAPLPARLVPHGEIRDWHVHLDYPWGRSGRALARAPRVTALDAAPGPGLSLNLEDGRTLWIGSACPLEFEAALRAARPRRFARRRRAGPAAASPARVSCGGHG